MSEMEPVSCAAFRALHESTGTMPESLTRALEKHANECPRCRAWLDAQNKSTEEALTAYFRTERLRVFTSIDELADALNSEGSKPETLH